MGSNLKITPGRAKGFPADTLNLVMHLSCIVSWLKTRNKLHVLRT